MRLLLMIIVGIIAILIVAAVITIGLKTPEMPVQEVHKILPIEKFKPKSSSSALAGVPPIIVPSGGNPPAAAQVTTPSALAPAVETTIRPGNLPGNAALPAASPANGQGNSPR